MIIISIENSRASASYFDGNHDIAFSGFLNKILNQTQIEILRMSKKRF